MILESKDKTNGITYERPSNVFDEKDIKEEYGSVDSWYAQNIRWVSSFYNKRPNGIGQSIAGAIKTGDTIGYGTPKSSPVDEILENLRYFFGDQENMSYAYLTQDHNGGQVPTPWVNGQQIFRLIEVLNNSVRTLLSNSRVSVESLNPSKISKRMEQLDLLETKRAFDEEFKKIEEEFGLAFKPEGNNNEGIDDVIEKVKRSPIDAMEEYGLDVVNDFISKNDLKTALVLAHKFAVIGRYCATYFTERSGRLYTQTIPPHCLILDTSKDSDYNSEAEFTGFIEFLSLEEINQKWRLTADEKKILKDLCNNETDDMSGFSERLNGVPSDGGFQWIGQGQSSRQIACVTAFWLAELDGDEVLETLPDGRKAFRRVDDSDEDLDTFLEIHRGTIIGNVVMKGHGREKNMVYHPNLQYLPMFPIRTFIPGMIAGVIKSPVDRMKAIQADIDSIKFKIKEYVGKSMGKVQVLNGAKIGLGGTDSKRIASDLKVLGFTVVPGSDGENPGALDGKPMSETMDFSLEKDVTSLVALIRMEEEMMKEVINASEISLGQQRSYVGLATQQETVARNDMGTATYVDGFMQYYAGLCQFGLNYAKVLYMDNEGAEEAQTVLSDDAIKLFKNTTEFQLEDMMIRVDIDDIIDEGARKRLLDIALAMAQNVQVSGFDFDDYLDIETSRTYSELRKRMRRKIQQKKKEAQEAAAQQQMMAKAQQEQQLAFQKEQQDKAEAGRDSRDIRKHEKDLVLEGFRSAQQQNSAEQQPIE